MSNSTQPSTSSSSRVHSSTSEGGSRTRPDVLRYIDLEADVDEHDDTEEHDENDLDDFLRDDDLQSREFSHRQLDVHLDRQQVSIAGTRALLVDVPVNCMAREHGKDTETENIPLKSLWLRFHEWKVLVYALNHANDRNTTVITSLHYRKDGDGLLYLDTSLPSEAAQILSKNPSVSHSRDSSYCGVDMRRLENLQESTKSLLFPPEKVSRGSWVRLTNVVFNSRRRPGYDGDLGLITSVDLVEGSLEVAFVCRLDEAASAFERSAEKKGRLLLSEDTVSKGYDFTGISVDHGLRIEWVANTMVVLISEPPTALDIGLFVSSDHPLVLESFPRVKEWVFREGETVESRDGHQRGRVCAVHEHGVEIITASSLGSSVEEHCYLGWSVSKCWNVGDYVQHVTGRKGLVVGFDGYRVYFWRGGRAQSNNGGDADHPFSGHRNALKSLPRVSEVDALLTRRSENASMEWLKYHGMSQVTIERTMSNLNATRPSDSHPLLLTPRQVDLALSVSKTFSSPWKWWDVLVWHGPQRGYHRVFDVLIGQKTKSGLKVHVQSTVVNALGHILAVDYDDVVDSELLLPLHYILTPPEAFKPPRDYCHPGIRGLGKQRSRLHLEQQPVPVDRVPTPPPPPVPTLEEVAWNPEAAQELSISAFQPDQCEWWKSHHSSQHELYELEPHIADAVRFQVSLIGVITELRDKRYSAKSPMQTVFFDTKSGRRTLSVNWMGLMARLPPNMAIHPQRPSNKSSLPMVVMRGEHRGAVLTKLSGVGGDIWANPVSAQTGVVDSLSIIKVAGSDCCSVKLRREEAHTQWEKNVRKKGSTKSTS
ncbi:hypothetical protein V5O48_015781 [Marasmius crinis-equi]|uniref:Uncharacterized protein n=1 Tax=Marasmius crinis-equi TaxID=585013 RepID=A0ABR3ETN7_9AGAR